jgi:hypothetical protein
MQWPRRLKLRGGQPSRPLGLCTWFMGRVGMGGRGQVWVHVCVWKPACVRMAHVGNYLRNSKGSEKESVAWNKWRLVRILFKHNFHAAFPPKNQWCASTPYFHIQTVYWYGYGTVWNHIIQFKEKYGPNLASKVHRICLFAGKQGVLGSSSG